MAAKLKTIKTTHLTHLSRAINSLETTIQAENPAAHQIAKYVKMVDEKYAKVVSDSEKLQDAITEVADLEKEIDDMDTLEDRVIDIKLRAEGRLELETPPTPPDTDALNATLGLIEQLKLDREKPENEALNATLRLIEKINLDSAAEKKERKSLLPTIELPKFDGNLEKYEEFIDSFDAIIQNHPGIEDVEKFIFLKKHLEIDSPASNLLAGFSTTSTEYPAALKLFKDTYGNKSLLRQIRISKLLNVPHLDSKNSLRSIYNQLTTHVRSLEGLGLEAEDYSLFLCPIVLSKMSRELVKRWYRKNDDSVNRLLDFLHEEVRSTESATYLEEAFASQSSHKDHHEKKYTEKKRYSYSNRTDKPYQEYRGNYQPSTATALHTVTNEQKYCDYCQVNNHDTQTCRKVAKLPSSDVRVFLDNQSLCYCCMKKNHSSSKCYHKSKLSCKICKGSHHTFLHMESHDSGGDKQKAGGATKIVQKSTISAPNPVKKVLFQTANAYLKNDKHHKTKIKVVFDSLSDRSYVTKAASKTLNLKYHEETLSIEGFLGKTEEAKVYKVRHANIEPLHPSNESRYVELVETDRICPSIHREAITANLLESRYLQGIQLAEDYSSSSDDEVDVLIGLDYYWDFVSGRVKRQKDKPIAVESILGWMLQKNGGEKAKNSTKATSMFISTSEGNEINQQLKKFWEVEEVGSSEDIQWSIEETNVHRKFKETITHEPDGKYQVRLPTKDGVTNLSSNKSGAIARYKSLIVRLEKNPELGLKYRQALTEFMENEFVEKIEEEKEPDLCYYFPHHPVINENKQTTKVRPVFEANASDEDSKSLNDYLYKGPPLQPQLNSVVMRFRINPIAFIADVKKMFLMIKLHPKDRDLLRFIWEDPLDKSMSIYRLTVLPFGLSCSPYLAIATVHHHVSTYEKKYPHVVKELIVNTYVDDQLSGAKTLVEAVSSYETEVQIMKEGGMELRKWKSNHPQLNERFLADKVASADQLKELDSEEAVLGISWNHTGDYFTFHEKGTLNSSSNIRPTKRNILKVAGKLYDPPGLMSPFLIRIKILIQQLWERGLEWDEQIPPDLKLIWDEWKSELTLLSKIEIPRYIGSVYTNTVKPVELHTFGDASESAYAAAAYLKSVDEEGTSHITLLYSKTKVSPVKVISLPRLELMAAVLAAKASAYVKTSLNIPTLQFYMWTDAQVTLHWIRGSSRQYKTFVANRIQLIHQLTEPSSWRWCPGEQNPADIPSRGCSISSLLEEEFWWSGPPWLKGTVEEYPNHAEDVSGLDAVKKEIKPKYTNVCLIASSTTPSKVSIKKLTTALVDPKKYSTLKELLKTTAYINRYLHNISNKKESRVSGPLKAEDRQEAEIQWLQYIQQHSFPTEVEVLKQGKNVKSSSQLLKFKPFYDEADGLIKMGGRLDFSDLTEEEKHPIILPNKSYIVKLIVEDTHRRQLHAGINQTLISLRYKYWIIRARQLVRTVVKSCFICRKLAPVRLQVEMAPLPRDRIIQSSPFEVVGIDFTGPLYVYQGKPKIKYDRDLKMKIASYEGIPCNKMYICLLTCAVTRAVHLELVWDLTTESFVNAFRRFLTAHGICKTIYSDNAKTFQKAEKDLKFYLELMKGKAFQNLLTEQNIQWNYILECSPWWGGFYERMMKTIKQPLKKILGKSRVGVDEMTTMLKEIEAQINSRPLTTISDEAAEQKYLTPASFLIGRSTMNMPLKPRCTNQITSDQRVLNQLLKQQNKYLETVWRTWREEYLRSLGTVNNKVNHTDCVKVGEIVLVSHQSLPRTIWEIGVIDKLTKGRDERVRTAHVRTAKGVIPRSVQHLSRLEADSLEDYQQYPC